MRWPSISWPTRRPNVKGLCRFRSFCRSWRSTPGNNFNSQLKHMQLADFHGHGWLFRYVYKLDG